MEISYTMVERINSNVRCNHCTKPAPLPVTLEDQLKENERAWVLLLLCPQRVCRVIIIFFLFKCAANCNENNNARHLNHIHMMHIVPCTRIDYRYVSKAKHLLYKIFKCYNDF